MASGLERKQTTSSIVSCFVDVGNIFDHWQEIGKSHGLANNQEIATFLVQCYDDMWVGKQAAHCAMCQKPLSPVCEKCKLSEANHQHGSDKPPDNTLKRDLSVVVGPFEAAGEEENSVTGATKRHPPDEDDVPVAVESQVKDGPDIHGTEENSKDEDSRSAYNTVHLIEQTQLYQRLFGCLECGMTFATASHLIVHVRKTHPYRAVVKPNESGQNSDSSPGNMVMKLTGKGAQKTFWKNRTGEEVHLKSAEKAMDKVEKKTGRKAAQSQPFFQPEAEKTAETENGDTEVKEEVDDRGTGDDITNDTADSSDKPAKKVPAPHPAKRYQCPQCGKLFSQLGNLTAHIRAHSGDKPYKCQQCSAAFAYMSGLNQHARKHLDDRPFKCDVCEVRFMYLGQLTVHIRKHTGERPFCCPHCESTFTKSGSLNQHLKNHTGERSHACPSCPARFATASSLIRHIRTHSDERPFKCKVCDATFKHKSSLLCHMHIHTRARPFLCQQCGRSFTHHSNLKKHMLAHSGSRPFTCTQCDKSFIDPSNLRRHIRTQHLRIKSFKCHLCSKAFGTSGILKKHLQTHTGGKPYKCQECAKAFTQSHNLKKHQNTHTDPSTKTRTRACTCSVKTSSPAAPLPHQVPVPPVGMKENVGNFTPTTYGKEQSYVMKY